MIRGMAIAASPPRRFPIVGFLPDFMRNPLRLLEHLSQRGDVVPMQLGTQPAWFVTHPDLVKIVLVTKARNFTKSRILKRAGKILGQGLLTSDGDFHTRQRRLVQPAFHRQRLDGYAAEMVSFARRTAAAWHDGQRLDVSTEMPGLTLRIVAKTLFGADVDDDAHSIGSAITDVLKLFNLMFLPFSQVLEYLPLPASHRYRRARMQLDKTIYRIIAERRASGKDWGDLLSMLLMAQDDESSAHASMTDKQVRDESMTLFLAGHETTANALMWTWYLLATHAAAEARLHAEVDEVLQGRPPTFADIPRLIYTERVVRESLRMYPPAWIMSRLTIDPFELGNRYICRGDLLIMSQWVMHHDSRYFSRTEHFDPDRWTPQAIEALPRFAYFPFGGGARVCIGESFAWTELILVLATIAQQWRLRYEGAQAPVPLPVITMRARDPMPMRVERRVSPR